MKNKGKILIFLFAILLLLFKNDKIFAGNYRIGEFPNRITMGTPQYVWNENNRPNGYTYMPYKSTNDGIPTFCTAFSLNEPPTGTTCTIINDGWSEPIAAGVAAIIEKANVESNASSSNLPYYYAEIAINRFLYINNGGNQVNRVFYGLGNDTLLPNEYIDYYKAGKEAYLKVKNGVSVDLIPNGTTDHRNLESSTTSISNQYKITGSNVELYTVSLQRLNNDTNIPEGLTAKITDLNGTEKTTFNGGESFKVLIEGLQPDIKLKYKVIVTGKMTYKVSANYNCGNYQTVTPNLIKAKQQTAEDLDIFTVSTKSEPEFPSLEILKRDSTKKGDEEGFYVANVKIKITKDDEDYKQLKTESEKLEISSLDGSSEGTKYCVTEVAAPPGFQINNHKMCFRVTVSDNNVEMSVNRNDYNSEEDYKYAHLYIDFSKENEPKKVSIYLQDEPTRVRFIKTYKNSDEKVNNVGLKVVDELGNIVQVNNVNLEWNTSDYNKDYYEVVGLPAGNYYLVETSVPAGIALLSDPIPFTIKKNETKIVEIKVENEKTVLNISKKDITNKSELKGATLRILDGNCENVVKLNNENLEWVSSENTHTIEGLPAGNYCLEETSAPSGYKLMTEKIKFSINEYGLVTVNNETSKTATVVMNNEPYKVYISKKSLTSGDEIEGAHLQLLDKDGKIVEEWDSTTTPHLIEVKLPVGTYTLKETIAPNGYVLSEETITFTVDKFGVVKVNNNVAKDSIVVMTNDYTRVYISKQDITTKQELPGAHLVLKDENGNIVKDGDWISTTEPHLIEGLGKGTYTLTEITAPDGYSLNEETITFTIDENGVVSGDTVMYNKPIPEKPEEPEVPATSAFQSIIFMIIGVVLVSSGVGLYIYGIKKKKEI